MYNKGPVVLNISLGYSLLHYVMSHPIPDFYLAGCTVSFVNNFKCFTQLFVHKGEKAPRIVISSFCKNISWNFNSDLQISSFVNGIYLLQMLSLRVFLVKSTNTLNIRMETQQTYQRRHLVTAEFSLTSTAPIFLFESTGLKKNSEN